MRSAEYGMERRTSIPHSEFRIPHWGGVVRLDEFRSLVARLQREIPSEFTGGVLAVDVSPRVLPHPVHGDVYTLGECVPLEWSGSGADLHSRIILYYGSFASLARLGDFSWREEAWETLTHELRHHLEWRANVDALVAYDWAAEQNFARQEGHPFDPSFFRSGEALHEGIWKVDDDVFIERERGAGSGEQEDVLWHGRHYRVAAPRAGAALLFLTLDGLLDPPPGDVILVVRSARRLLDVFRRRPAPVQEVVEVALPDG
jgi:Zincin-like metallopeptidase